MNQYEQMFYFKQTDELIHTYSCSVLNKRLFFERLHIYRSRPIASLTASVK